MEGFRIEPKFNKVEAMQSARMSILSVCDADIIAAFSVHNYTIEPLLIQLIREMRKLNDQLNERSSVSPIRSSSAAATGSGDINQENRAVPSGLEAAATE